MDDDRRRKPHPFRVIRGGADDTGRRLGGVIVVVAPEHLPPFDVDALAVEDDTYFVIGADPTFHEPEEHPIRVLTAVHDAKAAEPGTLRVEPGPPPRLRAVVHDLSREPSWDEAWIATALDAILEHCGRRSVRALALPPLGAVHGKLPVERFVELLGAALERQQPPALRRLWLLYRRQRRRQGERLEAAVAKAIAARK